VAESSCSSAAAAQALSGSAYHRAIAVVHGPYLPVKTWRAETFSFEATAQPHELSFSGLLRLVEKSLTPEL
jgi:hypothetical protein